MQDNDWHTRLTALRRQYGDSAYNYFVGALGAYVGEDSLAKAATEAVEVAEKLARQHAKVRS